MDFNNITTILDKPKHDQVAWQRSLELQKLSGAKLQAVAFVWNAMCESNSALNADERKQLKHGLVEQRKNWLAKLVAATPQVRTRTIWEHDIADWVADETQKKQPDLVVKTDGFP